MENQIHICTTAITDYLRAVPRLEQIGGEWQFQQPFEGQEIWLKFRNSRLLVSAYVRYDGRFDRSAQVQIGLTAPWDLKRGEIVQSGWSAEEFWSAYDELRDLAVGYHCRPQEFRFATAVGQTVRLRVQPRSMLWEEELPGDLFHRILPQTIDRQPIQPWLWRAKPGLGQKWVDNSMRAIGFQHDPSLSVPVDESTEGPRVA